MLSTESCRARAQECKLKAEAVHHALDRAKWLKLADDWMALTRIPFQAPDPNFRTMRKEEFDIRRWRGKL